MLMLYLFAACSSGHIEPQPSFAPCEVAQARPMKKVQVRKMQFSSCRQSWRHRSP